MAALPENWEMDYDGAISRWIYRFKPTGLVQYTFPKPGDEFPEFVGDFGGPMPPEDKFMSQKLKKGRATSESLLSSPTSNISTNADSINFSRPSYNDPPPWFQPDGFMFMGPGAYNDTSPEQDEDETPLPATDPKIPEAKVTKPSTRPFISPVTSTETTSLVVTSQPTAGTTYEQTMPAKVDSTLSPGVPMLDGRPINPIFPIGFVAELYGESTAMTRKEHPAAAELPGHEAPIRNLQLANADQIAPVELSSENASVKATSGEQSQKDPNSQKTDPGSRPNLDRRTESSPFILGANFASPPSNIAPAHAHRYSIQGQVPSRVEVPAVSTAKATPGQIVVHEQPDKAKFRIEFETDSKAKKEADKFVTQQVPSILQPARGRPKPLQSPSGGQQASSTTKIFVQRPLYDHPELDHQTVKPLHGHQSMILIHKKDELDPPPAFTRTNTLPADLPSLPFMGNGFSTKTEMSSPTPQPQDQQPPLQPAPSEEEPQMGFNLASTSRPHRGSLSDYANPVLPGIGQSAKPLNISQASSQTEVQGVDQPSLAAKNCEEQTAPMLAQELSQAIADFSLSRQYEPKRTTEMGMSDHGGVTVQWCQERMHLRHMPSEQSTEALPATVIWDYPVPENDLHKSPHSHSGSGPPRPDKIPIGNLQPAFTPYRPPAVEQTFRRKPVAESQGPARIPISKMGTGQQGGPFTPLGHFQQQGTPEPYVLPHSYNQQLPSCSGRVLPQPSLSNSGLPQTFPPPRQIPSPKSQARASTWPEQESTAPFTGQMIDLTSKALPPVSPTMHQARGLSSETSIPFVKEKRGLLSKFRRTGNTASSSNKLQKSVGNSYPTASNNISQSQPPVSSPPRQVRVPPQNTQVPFQGPPPSHPDQTQVQGYPWLTNPLDAWSASGHDPRAFTPTVQLGGPHYEPESTYYQQQWHHNHQVQQQQQQQQQVNDRRESEVSNLTDTSSPSPVPSNADTASVADSSRVSIISNHHTRPGSEGAASLASIGTIGRNSEITPPPSFSRRNGPGSGRWGSVSGAGGGGGGKYDGSGWGDFGV
ncbi:hypothetical protein NEUTE1DRAFT_97521 [Neurospora tetrasperma FGSC 2508]|uniref:WW domain-containing protein n=1 Tax=Neurospora tetrasperma (strain FGSC 2508 / ATCC MYA-4615 / P0657) TaxID=510951 RepID=F8MBT5_NEUT8|nr:uncharacterized protein NEUTE1DRAFT_97521 [Neurospora tetrasperma FGSC 2508]EGO60343.1 hypothetical protein NEUTE1DRAFT_97521 [Neurospora tetrasperma FGSC 2508]EGZ75682.1 hypothetical protein NEUTE2DRAFT_56455 [Neurospora tetrasperma FGSC 2509]